MKMELEQYSPQSSENVISHLWAKYFPYWPMFLLLIALAVGGAWLYLKYKLPLYESTATLLIKDEKRGMEDSKMLESLNPLASKKIIENEIEVIKSRALMNQVVTELKLYAPIFEQGKWNDISAYATSPVLVEIRNPDSLTEVSRISFDYDTAQKEVTLGGKIQALNQWIATPWGPLRFSLNNKVTYHNSSFYFSLIHPKRVVQNLINRLDVSSAKLSSVVSLKLKDEVPKRSEDILNTLITAYNQAAINDKNTLAENTLLFLDERLKYVSNDLDSIERRLQQYKARKGAINISSQGQLFLQNVSENDQKLSDVNMKIAVLNQIEKYIIIKDGHGGLVPSTLGINDPLLTDLLGKLYDVELQYEKLKQTTGENNPEVSSLANQIEKIKPSILENVHSQQRSLTAIKNNLFSTNNSYASMLQALPQQERDLVEISREQNIKSSIYSFLLQKREETALSHSSTVSDSRIVDKAESSLDPVGIGKKLVYILSAMLALGMGLFVITIRELFNKRILFRQEIETMTSFPVIGEVILEKSRSPLVIEEGKSTFIAEEFRMLRTSLQYLGIGSFSKKILITSTISGEGKSFIAANLAMSLAISGKKVILVEFDLNNPTLAHKLGITGGKGVTDYLTAQVDAEEGIRSVQDSTNLFLMTAGNLPNNPSELILSERTADLFRYLENKFDYVLIDSAPVGLLSDGYVLSRHCDATLFIVRHKYTPKKMLEQLERNNKVNALKNLAIVFNGVQPRGFGNNGYGYGYNYSYKYSISMKRERGSQ